jgi:hypothetical protein
MSIRYTVIIHQYAEKHYIKYFLKKYLSKWDITLKAIVFQLENVDELSSTNFFEKINVYEDYYIAKVEFTVAGTKESKKSSGCRYIVKVSKKEAIAELLLVYNKNDLNMKNETTWWQKHIEDIV